MGIGGACALVTAWQRARAIAELRDGHTAQAPSGNASLALTERIRVQHGPGGANECRGSRRGETLVIPCTGLPGMVRVVHQCHLMPMRRQAGLQRPSDHDVVLDDQQSGHDQNI